MSIDPKLAELQRQLGVERKERASRIKERLKSQDELCAKCIDRFSKICDGELPPECNASADMCIREELAIMDIHAGWSQHDKDLYVLNMDPVRWAKLMFNWEARWYQEEILRCTSLKKLVRAGRRIGKTQSLAVDALHHSFTTENGKVLVICPFQDQVDLVFQAIREFINRSPAVANSVAGDKQNPQRITFKNKSFIFGITAGTRTGMKGDKARGQDATAIYLDEADYLDKETLEALLAIFASRSDCKLWASSTPTGQRGFFYDWATKPRIFGFKEFHYPSNISPEWTPAIEIFYREMYPEAEYMHEFMAEFGDSETGVYKNDHIELSLRNYNYAGWERKKEAGYRYALGVDWNDAKRGVHIVGVEYNPHTLKMSTCLHDAITVEEYTQLRAVEHIINLHSQWVFDAIYVDRGWG